MRRKVCRNPRCFAHGTRRNPLLPMGYTLGKFVGDVMGGVAFGVGAGITERFILPTRRNPKDPNLAEKAGLRELQRIAGKQFEDIARVGVAGEMAKVASAAKREQREALAFEREILSAIRASGGVRRPKGITAEEWRTKLPHSLHHRPKAGPGIPLDELAQDFHDKGVIRDAYGDTVADYLSKIYEATRSRPEVPADKELRREARKVVTRKAKEAVRDLLSTALTQCELVKCPTPAKRNGGRARRTSMGKRNPPPVVFHPTAGAIATNPAAAAIVRTPSKLEAEKLIGWMGREGMQPWLDVVGGMWGVMVPKRQAGAARAALGRVISRSNPGGMPTRTQLEDFYWKSKHQDFKSEPGKPRRVMYLDPHTGATVSGPLSTVPISVLWWAWTHLRPGEKNRWTVPNPLLQTVLMGNPGKMVRRKKRNAPARKTKKNAASGPADLHSARELRIFIDNDGDLYRQQYLPIIKNLVTKRAAGKYDPVKAVKLWMYLVEAGAKKYEKQHMTPGTWNTVFNKNTRLQVARELNAHFIAEAELGNYDEYIPKKYRMKNPRVSKVGGEVVVTPRRGARDLLFRIHRDDGREVEATYGDRLEIRDRTPEQFRSPIMRDASMSANMPAAGFERPTVCNPLTIREANRIRMNVKHYYDEALRSLARGDLPTFKAVRWKLYALLEALGRMEGRPVTALTDEIWKALHELEARSSVLANPLSYDEVREVDRYARDIFMDTAQEGYPFDQGRIAGMADVALAFGPPEGAPSRAKTERRMSRLRRDSLKSKSRAAKRNKPKTKARKKPKSAPRKKNPSSAMTIPFKDGERVPIEKARKWVMSTGDAELIRQFKKGEALQRKANRRPKTVIWKMLPVGRSKGLDSVGVLVHYGDSPETVYKAPKGSKKGRHYYRHEWGDGSGREKPVPVLATPDGKAMVMPVGKGQTIDDWMRG